MTFDDDDMSFGYLSIIVVNYILRPFLTKWHPMLLDWEEQREENVSVVTHERAWEHNPQLRQELNGIRIILIEYAELLANVAGVPSLILKSHVTASNEIPITVLEDEKLSFYFRAKSGGK